MFVPFDTVQVRMPVSLGWIVLGIALPDTGTEIVGSVCGGGWTVGWLVLKALLKVSDDPLVSKAVTVEVRVMAAAFICATTVMFSTCPGAMDGTLQIVCVIPLPTAEHVPESDTAETIKAPSVLESTLDKFTLKMGNNEASVTVTV
jgi:hypothetical protein